MKLANACLEFLFYFILGNDRNSQELTNEKFVKTLLKNLDFSSILIRLMTELLTDNDKATQMVTDKQMKQIVDFLHPECWKLESVKEVEINPS